MDIKSFIRKTIYKLLALTGTGKSGDFILCYHSIGNDSWPYTIDSKSFENQINYLCQNFNVGTMDNIKKIIDGKITIKQTPMFVINFDDGYESVLQVKDFLKSKNIKPTIFLLGNTEESDHKQLDNRLNFLTKDQVLSLIADGWSIGSHGNTHRDFWKLSKDEIYNEVAISKEKLEKEYGVQVKYFSYPRGRYTPEIIEAVQKAGYELAVSMDDDEITSETNPFIVPRIGVNKSHSFDEFKTLMVESVVMVRKFVKNFAGGAVRKFI